WLCGWRSGALDRTDALRWYDGSKHLVDQGLPRAQVVLELPFAPPARLDNIFEPHGLSGEFLAHGPTEKTLLVVHADFRHVPGVIANHHVFSHIRREGGINIPQSLKANAIAVDAPRRGHRQEE